MQMRVGGLAWIVAAAACGGVRGDHDIVFNDFEFKGDELPSAVQQALEQIVTSAVEQVVPEPGESTERAARAQTLLRARGRAAELVTYALLDGPRARPGSPAYLRMRATVSRVAIRDIHRAVLAEVRGAFRPTILVIISEEHRRQREEPVHVSWEIRPDSKAAAAIESTLTNNGMRVVNGNQLDDIRAKQDELARLRREDLTAIRALALRHKADIIVYGHAKANGPAEKRIDGTGDRIYFSWLADVTVSAVWSDTGETLFTIPLPDGRREAMHEERDAGSVRALEEAGRAVAEEFLERMLRPPRRERLHVQISGVADLETEDSLDRFIRSIEGVEATRLDRVADVVTGEITTPLESKSLGLRLQEWQDPSGVLKLVVNDHTLNTLTAQVRAR